MLQAAVQKLLNFWTGGFAYCALTMPSDPLAIIGDIEPRRMINRKGFVLFSNTRSMANERPVGAMWSEKMESGVVLHMRVGTSVDMMLTLPNAEVAAQAGAQPRSNLVLATMRFQRIAKGSTSSGQSWEGFMPGETKAQIAAQAEDLVRAIAEGRLSRPLLAGGAGFLRYPAMASISRLAHLLKAVEDGLKVR
jgi:hypothetical protein